MKIMIAAVGRLKDGGEQQLFDRYASRFNSGGKALGLGPIDLRELVESRKPDVAQRKSDEATRLLSCCPDRAVRIVLDERGRPEDSVAFAARIAGIRDGGASTLAFLLGGPDGHGTTPLSGVTFRLSLGAMTLPHGLARVILAEQLYRATTILSGHPYHRG